MIWILSNLKQRKEIKLFIIFRISQDLFVNVVIKNGILLKN